MTLSEYSTEEIDFPTFLTFHLNPIKINKKWFYSIKGTYYTSYLIFVQTQKQN
jgi:hypothetical protein